MTATPQTPKDMLLLSLHIFDKRNRKKVNKHTVSKRNYFGKIHFLIALFHIIQTTDIDYIKTA